MNDVTKTARVIHQANNTWRYYGVTQYPMDVQEQKRVGLVAPDGTSRSIHGRNVKGEKAVSP